MKPRNRSVWKMIMASPVTLVVLLVILGFLTRAAWNIHEKARSSAERLEQAKTELTKLQGDQADLAAKTASLSTDAGIEAAMREKYRAVQPGESVAVIVDNSPNGSSGDSTGYPTGTSSQPALPQASWWQRLLRVIGL